jgi:hypothetical protein
VIVLFIVYMALLQDPTIQRILDEVNKAAFGGILGHSGKYISEPTEAMIPFESHLLSSSSSSSRVNPFYQDDESSLFYPTSDMLDMNAGMNFDSSMDFNMMSSTIPIARPDQFDLYGPSLYSSMQGNYMSAYEHYQDMAKTNTKHSFVKHDSIHNVSSYPSTNNDVFLTHEQHQEYSTMNMNVPHIGLDTQSLTSLMPADFHADQIPLASTGVLANTEHDDKHTLTNNDENNALSSMPNEDTNLSTDAEYSSIDIHCLCRLLLVETIVH